ncbi:MAG: lysophospholipase [Spirochaetaceae bacterium]|jgi:alpha-beta hydrolase superfamily lysophospholipase|nr:lysophospholipase [Spirochaetaceae bacterium]
MDIVNPQERTGMIEPVEEWFPADDGTRLFLRRWIPGEAPWGVLHIVHGMAEHAGRYDRLARRLCREGIEVWAADQRGHGRTADRGINDPGRGGLLGHPGDRGGFARISADIHAINIRIKTIYPGLPLFILGHSWGSFITQYYIEGSPEGLAGCILSGTRGRMGIKTLLGAPFLSCLAFFRGSRARSRLAWAMADGPFDKPFRPNRTPFDWLSRDEKEVDAYVADPLCGQRCTLGFYRDLTLLFNRIHKPARMEGINRDLPLYIFSGSADPVGDMGNSPTALVNLYRSMGVKDLEFVLYPGARHETLNETNREEVTGDLVAWLNKHRPVRG